MDYMILVATLAGVLFGFFTNKRTLKMTAELERLRSEVADITSTVDAAAALIASMSTQIRENADNPAALNALADSLDASQAKLAAAVASGTSGDGDIENDEDLEPIEVVDAPVEQTGGEAEEAVDEQQDDTGGEG